MNMIFRRGGCFLTRSEIFDVRFGVVVFATRGAADFFGVAAGLADDGLISHRVNVLRAYTNQLLLYSLHSTAFVVLF